MDPDEKAIYDHIIIQYRQDADLLRYDLARANAQNELKDQIIGQLREMIGEPVDDTCSCLPGEQETAKAPKPGPPPAR